MKNTKICLKIDRCEICNKEITDLTKLQRHISLTHKGVITAEEYYLKYLKQKPNKCPVCGEKTKFISFIGGYSILCLKRSCNVAYTNPMVLSSYMYHGCSEAEAKEKLSEYQRSQANKVHRTAEYYDRCFSNRLGYWTSRGYSVEEAKMKIHERQNTASLDSFINVYGPEDGPKHYNERIKKFTKTWNNHTCEEKDRINKTKGRTYQQLCDTYGRETALSIIKKRFHKFGISSKLERRVIKKLKETFPKLKTQLSINDNDRNYFYDCVIDNVIIEVNGDYWHANPDIYNETDVMVGGQTAAEIWTNDSIKKRIAEENGYYVIYVWENDINKNIETEIEKLKRKIYAFKNN